MCSGGVFLPYTKMTEIPGVYWEKQPGTPEEAVDSTRK